MVAEELGYYTLPVIASFEGIDKQVNSKLSKAFGIAGKQAGAELAQGAGDGLKALEREVESAGKAYQKLRDKASDAIGKVRVEEEKLAKAREAGKADQITAAEERLAKARRDSVRATREAQDSHKGLQDAQRRLADGTDDLGGRFGKLSGLAGSAGAAMAGAGALAGGAALAGIAALGAGVVTAGNRLYELGAQFDDLSDTLQTKTGLSGQALDDLKGSVEKLGTTKVPSTFGEIGDVAAEVTRNLHLTGQPLEDITSRLANLSRMGQEVNVRELGKAFRAFGVDVADQPQALNSLYEASTKSGLQIDDMTASVVKGGAALRALGLNFGESAALVATFDEAGLDADKMLAGLTKGSAAFAKDGKSAAEGLRDTISQIGHLIDVGDEVGATNLANKVFGAKGGVNFFDAIKSGNLDVQSLSESLAQSGLDINDVSDDTADWSERWQLLKNEVSAALEPLAGDVFDGVNEQLTHLADWVSQHKPEVIDFFTGLGDAAITGADTALDAVGQLAQGVGQFLEPFGDIEGAMLKFQAFQAKIRGDFDTERELNAQAEEWFSLGEGLDSVGQKMRDFDPQKLRDKLHDVADDAKVAAGKNDDLSTSIGDIGDAINKLPKDLPSWFGPLTTGTGPGQTTNPLDVIGGGPGSSVLPGGQLPGLPKLIPGAGGSGAGLNLQIAAANGAARKVGSDAGLLPGTVSVKDTIASQFSNISDIGGFRQDPQFPNEHPSGKAIDVMVPGWNTPQGKAEGDQIAAFALQQPGVQYVLWQRKQWNPDGTSSSMPDRGGATANHMDHVHVHVEPGGSKDTDNGTVRKQGGSTTSLSLGTNGQQQWNADWNAVAQGESGGNFQTNTGNGYYGGYQFTQSTWEQFGGKEFAERADQATPYQQTIVAERTLAGQGPGAWPNTFKAGNSGPGAPDASLNNAFGAGYKPGIGTPGYNEYGEPGYYEQDPKAVRQARQAIDDANERVKRADQAVAEAEARKAELDADASESQKLSAENALENAKADAAKARREADDAKTDAATTAQGKFTAAKEAKSSSGGKGGFDQLGGLGSIFGSFLKETTGLDGSFLPDISNALPMQMLNAGLNAFAGPLQGLVDGQLGIMQPGWQPGMPVNGVANDTGIGTSNAAFGMPDVAVPPMPPGDQHIGPGGPTAPGPVQNISIDQSVRGNVGSSPEELFKTRDQGLARAMPRIPNFR